MSDEASKRTKLSIQDRINIVKRLENGESSRKMAAEYKVTRQAVYRIKKTEEKLMKAKDIVESCSGDIETRFRYTAKEEDLLDQKLFQWFQDYKNMGISVTGPMLKKQALIICQELGGRENFRASDGWLGRFKARHGLQKKNDSEGLSTDFETGEPSSKRNRGLDVYKKKKEIQSDNNPDEILSSDFDTNEQFKTKKGLAIIKYRHELQQKSIQNEMISADFDTVDQFKTRIENIINTSGVSLDHIYNCDEIGLYWKMMPNEAIILKNSERPEYRKVPKNRLTIMLCTNASGTHKIPLLLIGKSANPRCFKDMNFPVFYNSQKNAWMTCDLMKTWYSQIFLPEIIQRHQLESNPETKIILIIDNAACHPPVEELNSMCQSCSILCLPTNVAAPLQPTEQGIIEQFKRRYRNLLLKGVLGDHLLSSFRYENNEFGGEDFLKSYNLLGCCNFCSLAWNQVTPEEIRSSWSKIIPMKNSTGLQLNSMDDAFFQSLLSRIPAFMTLRLEDVNDWLNIDRSEIGWKPWSVDDIILGQLPDSNVDGVEELDDEIVPADQECISTDSIVGSNNCPTLIEAFRATNTILNWYHRNEQNSVTALQSLIKINREFRKNLVNDVTI